MTGAGLRPYPRMKDSGLEWLGEVPEHWEVRRGKTVFWSVDERSETGTEELMTVSSDRGVVPRDSASVTMFKAKSYVGHKLCWPGDLVINSLWAWSRGLGVSPYHGIVSTAYGVYRVQRESRALPDFIHSLMRSDAFNWELRIRSKGIWISRLQLTNESFLAASIPLPPLPEQHAIVRYLDGADRRIRRHIRAKERLIELLEEQKQAIIHRAVTGQIDFRTGQPYPAYKDSGVDWLGKVPEHWEVERLHRCVHVVGGMTPSMQTPSYWGGRIPWVTPKDMKRDVVGDSQVKVTRAALNNTSLRLVDSGAVLIVVRGMILAKHVPVALTTSSVTINQDMKALSPVSHLDGEFLAHALRSGQDPLLALVEVAGHRTRRLPTKCWRSLRMALPPIPEQRAMALFVGDADRRIQRYISATKRQIALLEEYRTRLIADVVTGKLDVRGATADLPEAEPVTTGNRRGINHTEAHSDATEHDMAKEAIP